MIPTPAPRLLDGPRGLLFATNWSPESETRGTVICVPPFAEEMNRCRRTCTEFCMRAAELGWSAWQFDLYGTGDSAGDFADATWDGWREDVNHIASHVNSTGPLVVVAMRAGALLATEWLASGGRCDALLLWHPVPSGKQYLQQFLRLRVMARRFEGVNESLQDLLAEIDEKGEVEVAGYRLPAAVAEGMMAVELATLLPEGAGKALIFEAGTTAPTTPSRPIERAISRWHAEGLECEWQGLADVQCWTSQETVVSHAMIAASSHILNESFPTAAMVVGEVK